MFQVLDYVFCKEDQDIAYNSFSSFKNGINNGPLPQGVIMRIQ